MMGFVSDRLNRKAVLLPAFVTLGVLYFLLPLAGQPFLLALIIAAMGMFFYGTGNISTAAVLDMAANQVQGTTHSFMSLFQQVVTLPSPFIAGLIINRFGMTAVFYYASALLFLAALMWVWIRIPAPAAARRSGAGA